MGEGEKDHSAETKGKIKKTVFVQQSVVHQSGIVETLPGSITIFNVLQNDDVIPYSTNTDKSRCLQIAKQHDLRHLRVRWQVGRKGQGSCAVFKQSLLPNVHVTGQDGPLVRTHRTLILGCSAIYPGIRVTQSDPGIRVTQSDTCASTLARKLLAQTTGIQISANLPT